MFKPIINNIYNTQDESIKESKVVVAVTPINMNIMVLKDDQEEYSIIARITWLCKDNKSKLFCLTTTYMAENETDEEFLVSLPILNDKYFVNYRLSADILMSTLDHYVTDMNFRFKSDIIHNADSTSIYCLALDKVLANDTNNESNNHIIQIFVTPEVFSTLSFVDQYIIDGIYSNADLHQAISYGTNDTDISIYQATDVKLTDASVVRAKGEISLAVRVELTHNSKSGCHKCLIMLVSLEKKKKIANKLVKKNTLDNLAIDYNNNHDLYIQKFMFTRDIQGNDTTFVRGISRKSGGILIALSNDLTESLLDQINNLISQTTTH